MLCKIRPKICCTWNAVSRMAVSVLQWIQLMTNSFSYGTISHVPGSTLSALQYYSQSKGRKRRGKTRADRFHVSVKLASMSAGIPSRQQTVRTKRTKQGGAARSRSLETFPEEQRLPMDEIQRSGEEPLELPALLFTKGGWRRMMQKSTLMMWLKWFKPNQRSRGWWIKMCSLVLSSRFLWRLAGVCDQAGACQVSSHQFD